MNREDIDRLVEQIRYIILNKPISDDLKSESEELADLQEAVFYLSNCLAEANEFLKHLRNGELEAKPPSRHNFLAGNLKELHSALKHLTWQADRVAHGDYSQSVNFLGEFSRSFNEMIRQLAEREAQLKEQSTMLTETAGLMKSIMNGLKEWIIVTTQDSGEIIYTNRSAQQLFLRNQSAEEKCSGFQDLLDYITHYKQSNSENCVFEYKCDVRKKTFRIHSYAIRWSEKMAYVHFITDVTSEKEYREQIEGLAYMDELTGLYNRRFCLENLERHTEAHTALLQEASSRREPCPTQAQMEALARDVAEVQRLLQQAGKKKEISISPPSLGTAMSVMVWLALILLGTMVGMVVLQVIWSGLAALWSVIKLLIP